MYSSCESSEIDEQWLSTVWSHACPRTPRRSVTLSVFSLSVTLHHFCLHLHLSPLFFSTNTHVHVHTKWHGSMTHSFSALGHLSNYKHHRSWRDSAGRRRTGGRGQGMSVFDKQLAEALFLWRNLDMFSLLKQSANKHKQQQILLWKIWKKEKKSLKLGQKLLVIEKWSSVDQCVGASRGKTTLRFIFESWEDKEGSRRWRKDKERHVRARECIQVYLWGLWGVCMRVSVCDPQRLSGQLWPCS